MKNKLCVLHTNDTHSYLDDYARRAELIRKIRSDNEKSGIKTFLLDSGDVLTGNLYFMMYKGVKEAGLMNKIQYDAMTLGNHEFDEGSPMLANFLSRLDFPVLSANIDISGDPDLSPFLGKTIFPSLIKKIPGLVIGFFGMTTLETIDNASPSEGTVFKPPIPIAQQTVQRLKKEGAQLIILLSHLGCEMDQVVADSVKGIDLILGAHTHDVLYSPIFIGETAIVQAGSFGRYLGKVEIIFEDGKLQDLKGQLLPINDELEEAPDFKVLIDKSKAEKEKYYSRVIAEAGEDLVGDRKELRKGETNLSKLVGNAFLAKSREKGYPTGIAIINGMGIRTTIRKGPITFGDIFKVLPFNCSLMIFEMTGKELRETLENGLYPQTCGLKGTVDYTRPKGERAIELALLTDEPIDNGQTYLVATNSFVGAGKDNYSGFKTATLIEGNLESDLQLLSDYLASQPQPIHYENPQEVKYIF